MKYSKDSLNFLKYRKIILKVLNLNNLDWLTVLTKLTNNQKTLIMIFERNYRAYEFIKKNEYLASKNFDRIIDKSFLTRDYIIHDLIDYYKFILCSDLYNIWNSIQKLIKSNDKIIKIGIEDLNKFKNKYIKIFNTSLVERHSNSNVWNDIKQECISLDISEYKSAYLELFNLCFKLDKIEMENIFDNVNIDGWKKEIDVLLAKNNFCKY